MLPILVGHLESGFYFLNDELVWQSLSVSNGYFVEVKYERFYVLLVGFLEKNQGYHYKNMKARGAARPMKSLKYGF